jgi:hypothetical protein
MNDIKPIESFYEFKLTNDEVLNVFNTKEEPLFVRNEICDALEILDYNNSTLLFKANIDYVKRYAKYRNGKIGEKIFITYVGILKMMYRLNKPTIKVQQHINMIFDAFYKEQLKTASMSINFDKL